MSEQPEKFWDVPCELERVVGGWWCKAHQTWADECEVPRNETGRVATPEQESLPASASSLAETTR